MGCVRKRRGARVVDWREAERRGRRQWRIFGTKREAEDFLTDLRRKLEPATVPIDLDPRITLRDFVPVFMDRCRARGTRERTLTRYRASLDHFVYAMGHSFASIHVSKGVSIAAVKQWLGHASIAQTVDTYGAWLPAEAGVIDLLVVAEGTVCGSRAEKQGCAGA